ncbi:MAG TPA: Ig-like domain-containing protein [Candidatus Tumulicola sp.]|nr:Ig-like domain-containing protein [Candidatus Tumulicola sp.]
MHVDGVTRLIAVHAHATPAAPANLAFDDAQTAHSARGVRRLVALVTDAYGNPVSGVPVRFATQSGSVSPSRAVTDANGRVALAWTVGSRTGELTVSGIANGRDVKGTYTARVASIHAAPHTRR